MSSGKQSQASMLLQAGAYAAERILFRGDVVADSQRVAALGATAGENFAAIFGCHSLAETVLVDSAAV